MDAEVVLARKRPFWNAELAHMWNIALFLVLVVLFTASHTSALAVGFPANHEHLPWGSKRILTEAAPNALRTAVQTWTISESPNASALAVLAK